MTLAVMSLLLMYLPLAGGSVIAVPALFVQLLVQFCLVAWAIDHLRREAVIEALNNQHRRADDLR